jgi:hypothetical protein
LFFSLAAETDARLVPFYLEMETDVDLQARNPPELRPASTWAGSTGPMQA